MPYTRENNQLIVRLTPGQHIVESLEKICTKEGIRSGFFTAIGAVDQVTIAYYALDTKEYKTTELNERLEVTSLIGNLSQFEGNNLVHAHITVSDENLAVRGGHLVEARVSGTLELFFTETAEVHKEIDPQTGLKVMQLRAEI